MLSPRSISGRNDHRCSVTMAARSASAWKAGSPVGAMVSAYSTITAARVLPIRSRSSAASTRSFGPISRSSSAVTVGARLANRTPVDTL